MTRILGVDLGTDRTGVAVGSFGVAHPLKVVEANQEEEIVRQLAVIAMEENVREIVVGLATSLDGTEGPAAVRQRAIASQIEAATRLPVHLWDERLTTSEAEGALIGAGVSRKERRAVIDKVAASILLQAYMDAHAARPEPS